MVKVSLFLSLSLFFSTIVFAQSFVQQTNSTGNETTIAKDTSRGNEINISAEFRFRTEYRHGYRNLFPKNSTDTSGAFFTGQRVRLNFAYSNKKLDAYISIQDARVWGEQNQRNGRNTSLYLYEAFVEPHFNKNLSLRIGRQKISYDNQRLFSHNDWRNSGSSYDAAKLIYSKSKLSSELAATFNQSGENNFNTNYNPSGFSEFKMLAVHYLKWKPNEHFQLTTINAGDGYQSLKPKETNKTYTRFTSGGRFEIFSNELYFTTSAYYQYGKDSSGRNIAAYYVQPEIKYESGSLSLKLGAELISGSHANEKNIIHSFSTLYGSAHRFNGVLDLFTSFPKDVDNAGLINPYFLLNFTGKKWSIGLDNHWFFSKEDFYAVNKTKMNHYLGFEIDPKMNFKANKYTNVELGGAVAFGTKSMAVIKNPSNPDPAHFSLHPYYAYLMIQIKPTILQFKF